MRCDRRLYLNRDKSRVVEEGDKHAGFLFATPGNDITEAEAKTLSLTFRDGKVVLPGAPKAAPPPEPKPEPKAEEPKAAKKGEDKMRKRGGDKSARPPGPKPPEPPEPPKKEEE